MNNRTDAIEQRARVAQIDRRCDCRNEKDGGQSSDHVDADACANVALVRRRPRCKRQDDADRRRNRDKAPAGDVIVSNFSWIKRRWQAAITNGLALATNHRHRARGAE